MKGLSLRKKLVLILLFSFLSIVLIYSSSADIKTASALTTGDGLIFENGSIIGYEGTNSDVVIPSSINGQAIKSIDGAFAYNETITHITISEGITTITNGAFFNCPNLLSINIPASVFTISSGSLGACANLETINLNVSNTSFVLADNILYNADQTEMIQHISKSDTSAFSVPDTIVKIHDFAFANSANLTSVAISPYTTTIGIGAFASCPKLSTLYVYPGNPNYISVDGILYSFDGKTLLAYPANIAGVSFLIPVDVKTLAPYSFTGCLRLTNVTLSSSVTQVEAAFVEGLSLSQIDVDPSNVNFSSADGVLVSKDGKTLIQYPSGKIATSYNVPTTVSSIGEGAFIKHPYLQTITLQSSVTFIDTFAFWGCNSLTKLVVPESVTNFSSNSLSGADNMKVWGYPGSEAETYTNRVDIPFVAMGPSTDWEYTDNGNDTCNITGYKGIDTDIYIPSVIDNLWVDTIDYTTFNGCSSVEYIIFYESVKTIEAAKSDGTSYLFEDCSSLREVYLPASLEKFQTYTAPYKPFKGCSSLVNIIVDEDSDAFYDADGVLFSWDKKLLVYPSGRTSTSYSIPNKVTGISYAAFENNYLKTVTVPGSVTILSSGVEPTFKNNIETVYLSEGINTVMYDAFSKAKPMNIYFPSTVDTITGAAYPDNPHTFYVYESSAPYQYAIDNDINYVILCVITFNSNGGSSVTSQVVPSGKKVVEPANVTKAKNVLLGWYTDSALTTKWSFTDTVSTSMTLYAKWIGGYSIIYNMNGGINNQENPAYYVTGTTVILYDPIKSSYTFDGWYTNSSCNLEYKFEAIEKTTTGTIELWADWWIYQPTNSSSSSSTIDANALSDERKPEINQTDFPNEIAYMMEGQKITVTGNLDIKYANVEDIAVSYSGHTDKLFKYEEGDARLEKFAYSHTFELDEISYTSQEKYLITLRLSTGEFYQHSIPIYKYKLTTEVLHAPYSTLYMSSDSQYELRSMAIANESFELLSASYESLTPEICKVSENNVLVPLAAGTGKIKTKITLEGGSVIEYINEFSILERTVNEPSTLENEFMCPCYGKYCTGLPEGSIDPDLLILIEKIREETDSPIYILTGYRCAEYSRSINANEHSEHALGTAADIWSPDLTIDELYEICDRLNTNGGVGKYLSYVHIDTRDAYIRWTKNQ